MNGRIDSGRWHCWAVCADCRWRGPQRAGNANRAHDEARADLAGHGCQGEALDRAATPTAGEAA